MKLSWFVPNFERGFWSGKIPFNLKGDVGSNGRSITLANFNGEADWQLVVNGKPRPVKVMLKVYVPVDKEEADIVAGEKTKFSELW